MLIRTFLLTFQLKISHQRLGYRWQKSKSTGKLSHLEWSMSDVYWMTSWKRLIRVLQTRGQDDVDTGSSGPDDSVTVTIQWTIMGVLGWRVENPAARHSVYPPGHHRRVSTPPEHTPVYFYLSTGCPKNLFWGWGHPVIAHCGISERFGGKNWRKKHKLLIFLRNSEFQKRFIKMRNIHWCLKMISCWGLATMLHSSSTLVLMATV